MKHTNVCVFFVAVDGREEVDVKKTEFQVVVLFVAMLVVTAFPESATRSHSDVIMGHLHAEGTSPLEAV